MAAVTLFTVIVKEGGMVKLEEVLFIVIIGGECLLLILPNRSDHHKPRLLPRLPRVSHFAPTKLDL